MMRLFFLALSLHARLLFQDLPKQEICAEGAPWAREFDVERSCTETVRIARLSGLTREYRGEARLWLDSTLLGPLRREFSQGGWQSPLPISFSPGKHSLSIECGAEPFEIEGVTIGDSAPEHPSNPPPATPSPKPAQAKPQAEARCPGLKPNSQWLPGRPSRAILLSVVTGRGVKTPLLATLSRGEKLRWWFYVHPRPTKTSMEYPPVVVEWLKGDDGTWILAFSIDHEELRRAQGRKKKDYEGRPLGYNEDKWTPMDLALCQDGTLHLDLNRGEVHGEFPIQGGSMPIMIQTTEIEFEIKGENN